MLRERWEMDGGGGGVQALSFETITILGVCHSFPNLTVPPLPPPLLTGACT